ncbi:MAG: hypothetical protein IKO99_10070 [Bacteroidales bacterium]|nr:hypothetical protein [Bacteroidales bacterium]
MKKLNFLAAFFLAVAMLTTTFTSCNKDDDEGSSDPKDLVGTWKVISEEAWWKDSDGESGHEIDNNDDDNKYWETYTFNADGTWYSDAFEKAKGNQYYHDEGTYTTSKNKITIRLTYKGRTKNATFSSDNGVIKFNYKDFSWTEQSFDKDDDGVVSFSVSGNTLTFTEEETDEGDWGKSVMTLKKQ